LIFLDEPTSGLDAFQAQAVMESLWSLASVFLNEPYLWAERYSNLRKT